jgi:hypothetical protein
MQPHKPTASVWEQDEDRLLDAIVSVDGIRAVLRFKPDAIPLQEHPDLEFVENTNTATGEVYGMTAKFNGLTFTIQGGTHFLLRGSLHRLSNNGKHNADNFRYKSLLRALNELEERFGICLKTSRLENLESGANLLLPNSNLKNILDGLLMQGCKRIKDMHITNGNFHGAEYDFYYSAYYDKGRQYQEYKGTFRIEVKFRRSKAFKQTGIVTLADLKNPFCLLLLAQEVDKLWNKDTLFFDLSLLNKKTEFTSKEWELLQQWSRPYYWEQLIELKRGGDGYRNEWKRFEKLQSKHSTIKEEISEAIAAKWEGLRTFTTNHPEKAGNFTPPLRNTLIEIPSEKQGKFTGGTIDPEEVQSGEIHSLSTLRKNRISYTSVFDTLTGVQILDALDKGSDPF